MFSTKRKWFILLSAGLMIMIANLDMTITNVALPAMAMDFHASLAQVQWIITSYLLAAVLFFTVFGRLADGFGRKRIFLLGVFFFVLGSLLASFSGDITFLLVARFVQGLGFSATLGLSLVIILAHFPDQQKGLAAGLGVAIAGISQAIGPTLGGLIIEYLSWQWIFIINIPLGILSFASTYWVTPSDVITDHSKKISLSNVSWFMLGVFLLLFAFNQSSLFGVPITIGMIVLGVLALIVFNISARKTKHPLIDTHILTHRNYNLIVLLRGLFMILFSGSLFVYPLYLQNSLGYSPKDTGFMLLSMTALVAIMSPLTGFVMDRIGFLWPLMLSMVLGFVSAVIGLFTTVQGALLPIFASLAFLGIAIGLHVPSSIAGVNRSLPKRLAGTAIGLFFTVALAGSSVGVSLASVVLSVMGKLSFVHQLGAQTLTEHLSNVVSGATSVSGLSNPIKIAAKQAFVSGFHDYMLLQCGLMLIGILFSLYLYRRLKKSYK